MIFNDGQAFIAPTGNLRAFNVLDNLIYRREIPVMIGGFINPGRRPDQPEPKPQKWGDRDTNRRPKTNSLNISMHRSSSTNYCPYFTSSTTSRRIRSSTASAAPVPALSPRSRWHGNGQYSSANGSASLAASQNSAGAINTRISS